MTEKRITTEAIKRTAKMARLSISQDELDQYDDMNTIFDMIGQIDAIDTDHAEALAHPFDISQRLRPDAVTEIHERERLQTVAPHVEAGAYLVPKVLDDD